MQDDSTPTRTITVVGHGQASAPPDRASVALTVGVVRPSVTAARATVAQRFATLLETLASVGVAREDISSTHFSIHPEYDHRGDRATIKGFRTEHGVSANIGNIDDVGGVIDAVTDSGGDEVLVQSVSFSIADSSVLAAEARTAAWADASDRAAQLAELSDHRLGDVLAIEEQPSGTRPRMARMAVMEQSASTGFVPGDTSASVSLCVTFALVARQ